ncbi:MAG: glycine/betaine/sarcosine/D-proline family reductase selenoprotein B [Chloroflexi bacterium]|nr:glycine/betaine/sarcosine/D-proline family reductase selenoprotein B [Chloroflexota bacterium]
MRIVHFLNPFFAGVGGEAANDSPPSIEAGSRGPGRRLDELLGDRGRIVATIVGGDNYMATRETEALDSICDAVREQDANLVIAGPAFNAGRYGLACGAVCKMVSERLGIPAITAMSPENPGAEYRRERVVIVPTGETARSMGEVLPRLVEIGNKLARGEQLRPARVEGYLPRGPRYNERTDRTAAQRAVDMLLAKMRGEPFETEIRLEDQETVPAPPPLLSLERAVIGIVTETGFIPHGNPDRIPSSRSKVWGRYSIAGLDDLTAERFMFIHGGYDTRKVDEDPDRGVPVDVLRDLAREGRIGSLDDEVLSTCGNGGSLNEMKQIGEAMAQEVIRRGVSGVILPTT